VPPASPEKIAEAVIELFKNPGLRMKLGQTARDRVLAGYNLKRVGTMQEASYLRAVQRRKAIGARTF
jgi:glycosyltransferase involved in cell wall biosynthesis